MKHWRPKELRPSSHAEESVSAVLGVVLDRGAWLSTMVAMVEAASRMFCLKVRCAKLLGQVFGNAYCDVLREAPCKS